MSVPLSVVILTKNEASRIRDCIQSVRWADEVLVIDDESTDDTVQIAESIGARVLRRKMDVEGRHRNWAHAQAAHEWVLSLDADERVTPELAEEITALFKGQPPFALYAIPRRNYVGSRWIRYGGWYPSAQLKLFQKSVFRWEETTVHPRAFADRESGQLLHDLLHFSYRDEQDFLKKLDRQTTLEANKWLQDGRRISLGWALWRAADRCIRVYLLKQGFREGRIGLFIARMAGTYQLLSYRKYAQMRRARPRTHHPSLEPLAGEVKAGRASRGGALERETLSVVILTKNEEDKIGRCLESVRWADELIVIDGESEDRTQAIARDAGATVISHAFDGSFATDRNLGMSSARGDWVLQIDADDVVTPEFRAEVEGILRDPPSHAAFKFRRKSYLLGRFMRYGGWYHYIPNLVRRDAVRYEGLVHEHPVIRGTIGQLEVDIEHHPCEDLSEFLARHNRYTTLAVQELLANGPPLSERQLRAYLVRRPWKTFWKSYIKKQGFREGMHGLVFALFFSMVEGIKWAKYWERLQRRRQG